MNEIKLSFATITYKEPIVFIKYKDNLRLDVKEINEIMAACNTLSDNKPFVLLVDITNFVDITPEGNKASVDKKNIANLIASAPLVSKLGQRISADTFKEVEKPPYPMQAFDDKEEAIKWLMEQHKNFKS
jgi:hypothetical protein